MEASSSERTALLGHQPAIAKAGHGKSQDHDSRVTIQVPPATPAEAAPDPRIVQIVMVMVLAVFVYNADGSLVLATHTTIASEFDSLESSSWIFTAFGLAGAATQVMFGKLSDVYGRKPVILFCYSVFSIGCLVIGTAESLGTVIIGRVICGSVGAGMGLLVSILLVDIVPIRDLAAWRSYINLAATAGRSAGGPLGGWLADAVGWRWSFLGQVPFFMLASALCLLYLPDTKTAGRNTRGASALVEAGGAGEISEDGKPKAELDLVGALLLGSAILAFLFPVQMGGSLFPWDSPWIPALFAASLILLSLFVTCEAHWTSSPLLPLVLFRNREATASFLIMFLQTSAQVSLMFSIPIFFQVVHKSSSSEAGWHLFPAVLGNTLGSILSGMIIQRTGRYKWLVCVATLSSCLCYGLLILTWNAPVGWIKSMFVFPGGFGSGVAQSAVFVSLQNVIDKSHAAPALSILYLSTAIGPIIGVSASTAVMRMGIRARLNGDLASLGYNSTERASIVYSAISSVDFVKEAQGKLAKAIVHSYIVGLEYSHAFSLALAVVGFILVALLKDHRV